MAAKSFPNSNDSEGVTNGLRPGTQGRVRRYREERVEILCKTFSLGSAGKCLNVERFSKQSLPNNGLALQLNLGVREV